jgi:hypothetical protein
LQCNCESIAKFLVHPPLSIQVPQETIWME